MALPAREFEQIRLPQLAENRSQRGVLRRVTAIAEVEQQSPGCGWEEVAAVAERARPAGTERE